MQPIDTDLVELRTVDADKHMRLGPEWKTIALMEADLVVDTQQEVQCPGPTTHDSCRHGVYHGNHCSMSDYETKQVTARRPMFLVGRDEKCALADLHEKYNTALMQEGAAVQARDEAVKDRDEANEKLDKVVSERDRLRTELDEANDRVSELERNHNEASASTSHHIGLATKARRELARLQESISIGSAADLENSQWVNVMQFYVMMREHGIHLQDDEFCEVLREVVDAGVIEFDSDEDGMQVRVHNAPRFLGIIRKYDAVNRLQEAIG